MFMSMLKSAFNVQSRPLSKLYSRHTVFDLADLSGNMFVVNDIYQI
jgi:hypothetical protein